MTDTYPKPQKTSLLSRLHFLFGILAIVLLALPGMLANIGIVLLAISLLRLPTTINTLSVLIRNPLFVLFIAWWLLALLSTTWAAHPNQSLLVNPLLILIIPALYPLLKRPKPLIFALGLGVGIHTGIQLLSLFGIIQGALHGPGTISGGLHWYAPFTAMWSTVTMFLLLGLLLTAKCKRDALLSIVFLLPIPLSLLLTGNKTVPIVIPLATVLLALQLLFIMSGKWKRFAAVSVCSTVVLIVAGLSFTPGTIINRRFVGLTRQISNTMESIYQDEELQSASASDSSRKRSVDKYVTTFGIRYVWWMGGFEIWKDSPWIGHGSGSSLHQYALVESRMPTEFGADVEGYITAEPHSSILATAIEQGLLGILLMVGFVIAALIRSWRQVASSTPLIGLCASWFTVVIISLVHTLQFSVYASTLIMILVVLTLGLSQKNQKA